MEKFRSVTFDVFFYAFSIFYITFLFMPTMILPRGFCAAIFRAWTKTVMVALKKIARLDYREINKHYLEEAIKKGPVILACKHQSAWETIFCSLMTENFVIVLKKTLSYVPIYGLYLAKLNSVFLDRSQGIKSLKKLLRQCEREVGAGRSILIFPEGSRGEYGMPGKYQPGIVAIYRDLNIPVIPIGVNSGKFWPRKARVKKPGQIAIAYGEPIPPKLSKEEFKKTLEERIELLSAKD